MATLRRPRPDLGRALRAHPRGGGRGLAPAARLRPHGPRRAAAAPGGAAPRPPPAAPAAVAGHRRLHRGRAGDPLGAPLLGRAAHLQLVGGLVSRFTGRLEAGLGWRGLLGLGLGIAGVAALVGLDFGRGDGWALAAMVGVVLGYAVGPIIVARRLSDLPSLEVTAASLALAAILYAPAALLTAPAAWPSARALGAVAVLGVLCTAAAFVVFFELIAEVGPIRATVVAQLNPAVAVAAGVLVLGERFTPGTAMGFVLILSGSYLATRPAGAPLPSAAAGPVPIRPGTSGER